MFAPRKLVVVSGNGYQTVPYQANGIDPSIASNWGNGSWSEIVSSTPAPIYIVGLTAAATITVSNSGYEYEVEIGTGAAGSEVLIATLPLSGDPQSATTAAYQPNMVFMLPFPLAVPASTRLAVRARRRSTGGTVSRIKLWFVYQSDIA